MPKKKPKTLTADDRRLLARDIPRLDIGNYLITKLPDGSYWIEHRSGEGMQTSAAKLNDLIDRFYNQNF